MDHSHCAQLANALQLGIFVKDTKNHLKDNSLMINSGFGWGCFFVTKHKKFERGKLSKQTNKY